MNYSAIKYCDIANGEGVRTSLFVSGCRRHCPFCFNAETWSFESGDPFTEETEQAILKSLEPAYIDGLSVLGGEPMEPENQRGLVDFLERAKRRFPHKTIWLYTGDVYEDLAVPCEVGADAAGDTGSSDGAGRRTEVTARLLQCIDVLVDGPFVQDLKDIRLRFRGSSNQRLIDMNATRAHGAIVLWEDDPEFVTHTM